MRPTHSFLYRFFIMLAVIIIMVMLEAWLGRDLVKWLVKVLGISYQWVYGGLLLTFTLLNAYAIYIMAKLIIHMTRPLEDSAWLPWVIKVGVDKIREKLRFLFDKALVLLVLLYRKTTNLG